MPEGRNFHLRLPIFASHPTLGTMSDRSKGIVVFSGGSAANNLVDVFNKLRESKRCDLSYVIPISDNGGSSSELIRVFGGPGRLPFPSNRRHNTNFAQVSGM